MNQGLEGKIGILCSDISGTLLHIPKVNDIGLNGSVRKLDAPGREIHERTYKLLQEIKDAGVIIALVTGMRETSYNSVREEIPHDYGIIEHGGIILSNGIPDSEWYARLRNGIAAIQVYKSMVEKKLVVDDANRTASFRIIPDLQDGITTDVVATILKGVREYIPEENLELVTLNIGNVEHEIPVMRGVKLLLHEPKPPEYSCIEVVPQESGKKNAIDFLGRRYKMGWEAVVAFGDDNNDVDMLSQARFRMTFGSSKDEVKRVVSGDGAFITPHLSHRGTIDALEYLIDKVIPQMKAV